MTYHEVLPIIHQKISCVRYFENSKCYKWGYINHNSWCKLSKSIIDAAKFMCDFET